MPWTDTHLDWLEDTGESIHTACGMEAKVFSFNHDASDNIIMSEWATHFRNHYCLDTELKYLKPKNTSNKEYLELKFPNPKKGFGPRIRAGDFSEILVADYLQYLNNYYVPRTRYDRKTIGDESTKGSDVLAFQQHSNEADSNDELLVYEVKAKLTPAKNDDRLQIAVNDSVKDETRIAESLNAIRQRLFDKQDFDGVKVIDRFQDNVESPYITNYGAAAVITNSAFCKSTLEKTDTTQHPNRDNLELLVIRGEALMSLVHALYQRAANEA